MLNRTMRWSAALLAAVTGSACALGAGAHIGELAPPGCFLVASVDDVPGARAALERANLMKFWNEPDIRKLVEAMQEENVKVGAWLDGADVDIEELSLPGASLGLAMFLGLNDLPDDEGGEPVPSPQSLLAADYGEDAEGAAELHDAMLAIFEEAQRLGEAEVETIDIGGVSATRVVIDYAAIDERLREEAGLNEEEPAADDEEALAEDEWWVEEEMGLADRDLPRVVLFAQVGNVVVAASQRETFEDAVDRLGGKDLGPTMSDDEAMRSALAQHDAPHAWAALLVAPLIESLKSPEDSAIAGAIEEIEPMFLDSLQWIEPAATALGLDKVRALSAGVRADAPDGVLETTIAALAPEKGGIFKLFDGEPRPFTPSSMIGADASLVWAMRLNFAEIIPLARAVGASLPEAERDAMLAQIDMAEAQAGPILNAMGSGLTLAQKIERPYALESKRTLTILDVRDRQALSDALGAMAPMVGAESRDFVGSQVWESAFMPEMAVSVSAGGLVIGDTASVEGALREGADAASPKLADDARFREATRSLKPGIAHFYADSRARAEYGAWIVNNMDRLLTEQLEAMGVEEEFREDYLEMMREEVAGIADSMPSPELWRRYFGDTVGELRSTDAGVVYRQVMLRPVAN